MISILIVNFLKKIIKHTFCHFCQVIQGHLFYFSNYLSADS